MNSNKKNKKLVVETILKKINSSSAIVIAEYQGLTVKELQELREELKEKGVELKVFKNRLFKLAINQTKFKDINKNLTGQNIYAFGSEDDIAPAKIMANFAKKHEALKLKVGTYEGKVIGTDEVLEIATLPTYEEALTKLALALITPVKDLGVGLNMLIEEGHLKQETKEGA